MSTVYHISHCPSKPQAEHARFLLLIPFPDRAGMPTPSRSRLRLQYGSATEAQIGFGEPGIPKHPWQGPGMLGFPGSDSVSAHRPHSSLEADSGPSGGTKPAGVKSRLQLRAGSLLGRGIQRPTSCPLALLQINPRQPGLAVPLRVGSSFRGRKLPKATLEIKACSPGPRLLLKSPSLGSASASTGPSSPAGSLVQERTHSWGAEVRDCSGEAPPPRPRVAFGWSCSWGWGTCLRRCFWPLPHPLLASTWPAGQVHRPE